MPVPFALAVFAPLLMAQSSMDAPAQSVAEMRNGATRSGAPASETVEAPSRLRACLNAAAADPVAAAKTAAAWLKEEKGSHQAQPLMCLGSAFAGQQRWAEAVKAFIAGRDIAAASDHVLRAQLGAMGGNAELAQQQPDRALALLDVAHVDALTAGQPHLAGDIDIDRARALVALKRDADASAALTEARIDAPNNGLGWLLSATLARRMGKLDLAQTQIQTASLLLPMDPEIGLEAGVIAMLSGHHDAAAKSWRSVIAAAPSSPEAKTARGYLAQLDSVQPPVAAPSPTGSSR